MLACGSNVSLHNTFKVPFLQYFVFFGEYFSGIWQVRFHQ
jgi:hypothetical protein